MSCIVFEKKDRLAIIRLNRPEKMNPIGMVGDAEEFIKACEEINADQNIRCVILTGTGKAFSAGGDLDAMHNKTGVFAGSAYKLRENYRNGIQQIVTSLWNLQVPVVAAVNGHAIGLGNDLATTADIRIASSKAKFGATFTSIGLVPGDGGAWLLPRTIGRARASELFFTGDLIDANTAMEWGLVSQVVAPEEVMQVALAVAEKIINRPPLAVRMTKQMLRKADDHGLDVVMEMACGMQAILHNTKDHELAVEAVINKTQAEYTGK